MVSPTPLLIDALYREEILRARRTPPVERMLAAGELFDEMCARMIAGIRAERPEANDDDVRRELARRFAIARRREARE